MASENAGLFSEYFDPNCAEPGVQFQRGGCSRGTEYASDFGFLHLKLEKTKATLTIYCYFLKDD